MRVAFVHPDLGIGGAERLVVDSALALNDLGHHCTIYTAHYDPMRSFREVAPPDPRVNVKVVWLPVPRAVCGRFHVRSIWFYFRKEQGASEHSILFAN